MKKRILHLAMIVIVILQIGCTRPETGVCSHCPVWWIDPVCLSGGNVPDPIKVKVKAPPTDEVNLLPGQENAILRK